jgi:hypothetical protein
VERMRWILVCPSSRTLPQATSVCRSKAHHGEPIELYPGAFRAPELWFGDSDFGPGADSWAAGLVMLAAFGAAPPYVGSREAVRSFATIAVDLGWPTDLYCRGLLAFPTDVGSAPRPPWPALAEARAQFHGLSLIDGLLTNRPADRLTSSQARDHVFFDPCAFPLGGEVTEEFGSEGVRPRAVLVGGFGTTALRPATAEEKASFNGARHPWNVHVGTLAPEVLELLRADPALREGSPEYAALFDGEGP